MMQSKYAPRGYYRAVTRHLDRIGFEFLGMVCLSNEEIVWHVPTNEHHRLTSIFVHLPNKAFVLQLVFQESINPDFDDFYDCSIDLRLYAGFSVEVGCHFPKRNELDNDFEYFSEDEMRMISGINAHLTAEEVEILDHFMDVDGFQKLGGSLHGLIVANNFELELGNVRINPRNLANLLKSLPDRLRPFLEKEFDELYVGSFSSPYVSTNSEELFWERFPLARLREKTKRVWGSEFLSKSKLASIVS